MELSKALRPRYRFIFADGSSVTVVSVPWMTLDRVGDLCLAVDVSHDIHVGKVSVKPQGMKVELF